MTFRSWFWLETLFYSHRSMLPALFTTILSFGCQKERATRKRRPSKTNSAGLRIASKPTCSERPGLPRFSQCLCRRVRCRLTDPHSGRWRQDPVWTYGRAFTVGTSLHAGAALVARVIAAALKGPGAACGRCRLA